MIFSSFITASFKLEKDSQITNSKVFFVQPICFFVAKEFWDSNEVTWKNIKIKYFANTFWINDFLWWANREFNSWWLQTNCLFLVSWNIQPSETSSIVKLFQDIIKARIYLQSQFGKSRVVSVSAVGLSGISQLQMQTKSTKDFIDWGGSSGLKTNYPHLKSHQGNRSQPFKYLHNKLHPSMENKARKIKISPTGFTVSGFSWDLST